MDDRSWTDLAIALLALAVLAVAATTEAVAGLVPRSRLRQLGEQRGRDRTVKNLLDPRRALIASVQLLQAIAVAVGTAGLSSLLQRQGLTVALPLAVLIVVAVYLAIGQALPRAWATSRPERAADTLLAVAGALAFVIRPLTALSEALTGGWARLLPPDPDRPAPAGREEELRAEIEVPDDGLIEPEEQAMIENVLQLEETAVRDIMVPRVDIVAVEERASAQEILETITRAGHSRLPVYRDTIDRIVGILYAKDLLPFVMGTTVHLDLARLLRPVYVVPESKRIDDLLTELRRNKVHIAVVADEYGGTAGLVTIEDILEEIVGEIQDEYDVEAPLLETVGPGAIVVDGGIPLDEVEDALDVDLQDDEDEVSTAAGFVHRHLERLPEVGDTFEADGVRVEVLVIEGHRLRRLRIERLGAGAGPADVVPLPAEGAPDGPSAVAP